MDIGPTVMRLIKGLAALVALAVLTAGIPTALVMLGGNPLPGELSWSSVTRALLRRDDGTILVGLITLVAWVAWLVFAVSLVAELVRVLSGFRVQVALPGLGGPQRLVAGLLLTVLTMLALPAASYADPGLSASASASVLPAASAVMSSAERGIGPARPATVEPQTSAASGALGGAERRNTHRVQQGDDLWSLAEHYYGSGRDWRKIAAANPALLTGGPDRLQVGWQLVIPELEAVQRIPDSSVVTVQPGDSLSSIAEQVYGPGHQDKWRDIFDANRRQIDDPDTIEVGARLHLPASSDDGRRSQQTAHQTKDRQPSNTQAARSSRPSPPGQEPSPRRETTSSSRGPSSRTPSSHRASSSERPYTSAAPAPTSTAQPPGGQHGDSEATDDSAVQAALGVGAVGALLAASVLGGLALRRRVQLRTRPVGRRLPQPSMSVQAVEAALGARQAPLGPQTLDLALRAIAAHCQQTATPVPSLALAKIGPEALELVFHGAEHSAPVGFSVSGQSWHLGGTDADYLASLPGIDAAATPYPALVTLGTDSEGRQVMADLEAMGLLALHGDAPAQAQGVLAAMATELAFSPWAEELVLTLVGTSVGLPDQLGRPNVTQTDAVDDLLDRLEQRAATARAHQPYDVLGQHRVDPDLADPWVPEIVLVGQALTEEQRRRLVALTTTAPRVPLVAVFAGRLEGAPWVLELAHPSGAAAGHAVLQPLGLELEPQLLTPEAGLAVVALVSATGSTVTTPAPWWSHEGDEVATHLDDNVTHIAKRFGGWGTGAGNPKETDTVAQQQVGEPGLQVHHPILRLLGPVELVGATGTPPPRANKQCLEYCGWLLEHPGTTAQAMASALVVAEGTRRSNMSRLRSWLGADAEGASYLPDAYTGRILLHPSVSSDWQRLQILTAAGINKTSSSGLRAALELVRGAPLADAAPGQWHWAEELRTDMISAVRDTGVELASRALDDGDIDLARWAAARALVAAPGDELLMAARIRTEHQAGHVAETERLTLQLANQARALGVDLESETVMLLQEVMEGRVRARMA